MKRSALLALALALVAVTACSSSTPTARSSRADDVSRAQDSKSSERTEFIAWMFFSEDVMDTVAVVLDEVNGYIQDEDVLGAMGACADAVDVIDSAADDLLPAPDAELDGYLSDGLQSFGYAFQECADVEFSAAADDFTAGAEYVVDATVRLKVLKDRYDL